MQKRNRIAEKLMLLSAPLLSAPAIVSANWTRPSNTSGSPSDLTAIIGNIINWILGFISLVAVLLLIFGGIQYVTAAGNQDQVKRAKDTIKNAIIGLIVAGVAYAIVNLIIDQLHT